MNVARFAMNLSHESRQDVGGRLMDVNADFIHSFRAGNL
jgi:hypothetical protein